MSFFGLTPSCAMPVATLMPLCVRGAQKLCLPKGIFRQAEVGKIGMKALFSQAGAQQGFPKIGMTLQITL